ncbi:MAG: RidA family protein [Alphaproteobacteria bacterium]|nr:RidA family protein [Alphaproteobacteria bacterium]MBN9497000.1 RidA family protein [Alphaproteobacteria bacterium]
MPKTYNPATIAKPTGRYQHAIEVKQGARTLYLSGQVGNLPDGSVPKTIEAQAAAVWANIGAILADAGMGFADLIKITILLTDKAYILPSRAARDKALGDIRPPASTLMIVSALASPDFMIEIEAIAAKEE